MKVSRLEIQKAKEYRDQILGLQSSFSPTVEDNIRRFTGNALLFDIETGGLDSKSSIYEMGFMRGIGSDAQFSHHLVRPNRNAPSTSEFTNQRLRERNKALEASTGRPDAFTRAIRSDGITQREAALTAYDYFKGKDLWVQNLRFEREALNERVGGRAFDDIARGMGLESFSKGGGVHVTPIGLKRRLAEAGRQYNVGTLDSYLNSWEDVFTKGFIPELSKPQRNMTRAFEVMDLTKSVFAMAQKRGYMAKTGDLFTGTSIDAFAKSMFGLDELHAANADNVLQGRVIHNMLGAGLLMQEGQELPEHMQKFFKNLDAALPEQRHRNAVKNIIRTFRDQQEFRASQAEGAPKWSLLEGSRLDREPDAFDLFVDTTDDGKTYRRERILQPKRASVTPGPDTQFRYTTSIDELTDAWQSQQRFGPTVNYKAALEEARASYINHYQSALGGSSSPDSIRKALASTESIAVKAREALEQASWKTAPKIPAAIEAKPAGVIEQGKNFIKSNWKIGLAGAGLIVAANLISGDDDDYNYIEGMRHAGISGSSRKQNTDFGSGWNALRGLVRAGETFEEMLSSGGFKAALGASTHVRDLGAGMFGKTTVRSAQFRGHEFDFVRKVLNTESKAKTLHTVDFHREAKFATLVSESIGPNVYGVSSQHLDMELFAGTPLRSTPLEQLDKIRRPVFDDAINKLHEKGIYHSDLNPGNIMYIPEEQGPGKIGIIDFGHNLTKQHEGPSTVFTGVKKELIPGGGVKNTPIPISWEEAQKADFKKAYEGFHFAKSSSEARQSGSIGPVVKRLTTPEESASDVWIGVQPSRIPGRPASNVNHNTIQGLPDSAVASARRGQNTGGQFHSPWQGVGEFGAKALGFFKQNPKIAAMVGAGAVLGISAHHGDKKESSSIISTLGKGIAISGALIGAGILAPAALTAYGARNAARISGQANPNSIAWKTFKGMAKANWEFTKSTVGIHYKVHTGESANLFRKAAEAAGIDTGLKAAAIRGYQGPLELGKKAVHHTAEWLGKNWVPKANQMDPGAVALAVASGYEAVGVAKDISEGDIGGAMWGMAKFAGAKYAYMGWHYRDKIRQVWQGSNKLDKMIGGMGAGSAAMNYQAAALEGINLWLAHARWGVSAKDFYPKVGAEFAHGLNASKEKLMETAMDLMPELQGVKKKDLYKAAIGMSARIQGEVKTQTERSVSEIINDVRAGTMDFADRLNEISAKIGDPKESMIAAAARKAVAPDERMEKFAHGWIKGAERLKERTSSQSENQWSEKLGQWGRENFSGDELAEINAFVEDAKLSRAERRAAYKKKVEEIFNQEPSTVSGRPQSNIGDTIHGFADSATASSRRMQNTKGQFGSPWQGLGNLAMASIFTANAIAGSMPALPSTATKTADIVSQKLVQGASTVTENLTSTSKAGDNWFVGVTKFMKDRGDTTNTINEVNKNLSPLGMEVQSYSSWDEAISKARSSGRKNIVLQAHGLAGSGYGIETGVLSGGATEVDIASASWISSKLPESEGYKIFLDTCNANTALTTNRGFTSPMMKKMVDNTKRLNHTISQIRDSKEVVAKNVFTRRVGGLSSYLDFPNAQKGVLVDFQRVSPHFAGSSLLAAPIQAMARPETFTNVPGVSNFSGAGLIYPDASGDMIYQKGSHEAALSSLESDYQKLAAQTKSLQSSVSRRVSTSTLVTDIIPGSEIPSNISIQSTLGLDMMGPRGRGPIPRGIRRRAKVKNRKNRQTPTKLTPIQESVAQTQPTLFEQQADRMALLKPSPRKTPGKVAVAQPGIPVLNAPVAASIPRGKVTQQSSNAVSHVAAQVAAHTEAPAIKVTQATKPILEVPKAEGVVSRGQQVIAHPPAGNIQGIAKPDWVKIFAYEPIPHGPEPTSFLDSFKMPDWYESEHRYQTAKANFANGLGAFHGQTPEQVLGSMQSNSPGPIFTKPATVTAPTPQPQASQPARPAEAQVSVRAPTAENHPNRQASNIVSAVADEVAEKTIAPAVKTAVKTEAVNPIARAEGAVSGNKGLIAAAAIGLGGLFWAMSGSSKKDGNDQFGSPWSGLRYIADDLVAIPSEQYAMYNAREEKRRKKEQASGNPEGINPYFGGEALATVGIDDYSVEDADTIKLFMGNGQTTSMRLAGIDAPEIAHEGQEGKIWPNQPYGQEAKTKLQELLAKQSNIQAVIDPRAAETYGRPIGMLIGDNGQNLNLELVKSGAAASLPYGKRSDQIFDSTQFKKAERDAVAAQAGMWSTEEWNIAREAQLNNKRRITNVSYTDLGRLFKDFKTSSVLNRMRNPDAEFSDMQASGGRDDFNVIEGMRHGWIGANRTLNTDFGSPYKINTKTIPRVPRSYHARRRVIEGQYAANTQLRRSMKRESYMNHHKG